MGIKSLNFKKYYIFVGYLYILLLPDVSPVVISQGRAQGEHVAMTQQGHMHGILSTTLPLNLQDLPSSGGLQELSTPWSYSCHKLEITLFHERQTSYKRGQKTRSCQVYMLASCLYIRSPLKT